MIYVSPSIDKFPWRSRNEFYGKPTTELIKLNQWCSANIGERAVKWDVDYNPNGTIQWCFATNEDFTLFTLTWR